MTAAEALKHRWFGEQLGEGALQVKSNHVISAHSRRMVANFSEYLAKQRLKKVALNFIASDLTESEAEPVLEIFQQITKSEKDVISLKELDDAIHEGKPVVLEVCCADLGGNEYLDGPHSTTRTFVVQETFLIRYGKN